MEKLTREEINEFVTEAWLMLEHKHKPTEPSKVALARETDSTYYIGGVGKTKAINKDNVPVHVFDFGRENHFRMVVITDFYRRRLGKIYYFLSYLKDEEEVWDLAGFTLVHSYKDGDYTFETSVNHFGKKESNGAYAPMDDETLLKSIRDRTSHPYVDIAFRNEGENIFEDWDTVILRFLLSMKPETNHIDLLEKKSILEGMLKDAISNGTLTLSRIEVDRMFGFMKMFFLECNTRFCFLGTCDRLDIIEPFMEFARAEEVDSSEEMEHALSRYTSLGETHRNALKEIDLGLRAKMSFKTMGRFLEIADGLMEHNSGQYEDNIDKLVALLNTSNKNKKGPFFEDKVDYLYEIMDEDGIMDCIDAINK